MAERVAVFESVFGTKRELNRISYAKECFMRAVPVVSGELVPLTIALLEINCGIRQAHFAMNNASLEVDDETTSEKSVEARAKAISLTLKHHTFLNTLDEFLAQPGWPDDDAAIPFHSVSRQSPSSRLTSDASLDTQPSSRGTGDARKRPRDPSEDPLCPSSPKRFRSSQVHP
jgi:hypothetical protein